MLSLTVGQYHRLDMMRATKQEDEQLNRVWKLIRNGWPTNVCSVPEDVKDYYTVKDSLSLCEGLVTLGCHIVVPQSMTQEILARIHEGHQSLSKYRECAQETVWWPKISADIKNRVETSHFCQVNKCTQHKEPLQSIPLPEHPSIHN